MSPMIDTKIEILSTNKSISDHELDTFDHPTLPNEDRISFISQSSEKTVPCVPSKPILITGNSEKNIIIQDTNKIQVDNTNQIKCYESVIDYLWDESFSTIPIFMKYFAFHECTVLICGALYWFNPDIGVLCLSILPGISIIAVFTHFLMTQFRNITINTNNDKYDRNENLINTKIKSVFYSWKHYLVAFMIFIIGLLSIYLIYKTNTYLSTLVPTRYDSQELSDSMQFIGKILKFPHLHSIKRIADQSQIKPFNYRISFVGSIIAPIIEESFKYLLVFITFPILFIWSFVNKKLKNKHDSVFMSTYSDYCIESLFIMYIAVCGGCGIAIMENIGYLAACEWETTRSYCLPNKNFDILGAGLARGIFSVPFHCATACIMADIVCMWMNSNIKCFNKNGYTLALKYILSYPISIMMPVFLHSSFNYWMKGIPFVTGCVTVFGFSFLTMRISVKHSYLNGLDCDEKMNTNSSVNKNENDIDLTLCDPDPFLCYNEERVLL